MAEQSLKEKTVKGTFWSGIDNVVQYGVSFIVSIVLARLLTPDDYGLIGIISIFTAVCTALINAGFTTALIRKNDCTEDDYNTAFIINVILSVVLYVIIFLFSPLIAQFFGRYELVSLTRVSSLGMIIGGLAIVQQTRLTKRIDFKTQTKITLIASLVSGVFGIAMALTGFGVWSLVAQGLSLQTLRTILLWIYNKWLPSLNFSFVSFKSLFTFGWKIMVSNLLDTVWKELNQVVVGKFYSPASLGQYTRADQFSKLFSSNLTNVIQRVTFPVLSNIQDEKDRMVAAYRRLIKTSTFITAVGMFFLGAISDPLLFCLIGEKWHEAAIYLPLICIAGSTYPLQSLNLNMLEVQGRSDLFLGLEVAKKLISLFPLFVGAFISIKAMLYVNLLTTFIAFLLNSHYSGKLVGYSTWMQMKDIAPSYGLSILIALSVYFLKYLPVTSWAILPMQIVIGCVIALFLFKITKIEEWEEVKLICKPLINKIKKR